MLQLFIYRMANFYKKNFRKKIIPSWCKGGKYPQKGAPKATVALGASLFCPRHQRVRKNLIFIHPQDEGPRGTTFK